MHAGAQRAEKSFPHNVKQLIGSADAYCDTVFLLQRPPSERFFAFAFFCVHSRCHGERDEMSAKLSYTNARYIISKFCTVERLNIVKRCYSLKRNKEFRRVYRAGKSVGSRTLVLIAVSTKKPDKRIGFSVGKKIGNAVQRNHVKRRLREAVTPLLPKIPFGYRLIFIARAPITAESYSSICNTVQYLLHKAHLV